jgi:hypothetical protein
MFLILMTSQIVNLEMIGNVLVLKKCYQCGGETLGPVVKHSVRDNICKYFRHFAVQNVVSLPYQEEEKNLNIFLKSNSNWGPDRAGSAKLV